MPPDRLAGWLLCLLLCFPGVLPAEEGPLHVGSPGEPASLDPHRITGIWENRIVGDMFVGLTTEGPDGSVQPGAASGWEVSDDGLLWAFQLRPHQWSDGRRVTARDFVQSFRRMLDPATASAYADFFFVIDGAAAFHAAGGDGPLGISAPRDDLLEIRLEHPVAYLPGLLMHFAAMPVPMHVIAEHGDDWTRPQHMVVNGPFLLEDRIPNARVELVRNPMFWDAGSVALGGVIYHVQEDRDGLVRRFRTGELHVVLDFPASRAASLRESLGSEVRTAPQLGLGFIAINHRRTVLADARVRRALSLAVDREVLAQRILGSGEQAALSLVPPGTGNYGEPAEPDFARHPREQRLAESRGLLAAAAADGLAADRLQLRLPLSENDRRLAVALQSMWREVGVAVSLDRSETAIHYSSLQSGDFDLALASWFAIWSDPQSFTLLLESGTGANNFGAYQDAEYDRLTGEAALETDLVRRTALLRAAEQRALDDTALIPLYHHSSRNLVSSQVRGWTDNLLDVHRSRFLSLAPASRR
ncbi:MAG: peptide ABC transporter substrate-binding protein [Chromatiales bacterium]|nr:peptide ABC transporter substrate-binding protein [Chromatiales bacterium]